MGNGHSIPHAALWAVFSKTGQSFFATLLGHDIHYATEKNGQLTDIEYNIILSLDLFWRREIFGNWAFKFCLYLACVFACVSIYVVNVRHFLYL